uniref:DNA-directed RNA polymerase subunit n=1 Tax=Aureoumbra lagunensis TaxID=44058 RepID=A0A7S3JTW6_9STRA
MIVETWNFLQVQVALYFNGELGPSLLGRALPSERAKPIRGLCQRLKGKSGRFRGNLSGKRVDFSGRTVISPDPNLRIDQVGVPLQVAKILTYPERVTNFNLEQMKILIKNGPHVHPGANYVEFSAENEKTPFIKKSLQYGDRKKIAARLRVGDIVERHICDDDIVLFNRQPSLHKLSIMAHRVKVMPWRTFRFNECVCAPYNADFDGDEMNLHLPQTEEAKAEAAVLMPSQLNISTPRNGEPLIAATQDFLTAVFLLTQRDIFFNKESFCALAVYAGDAMERIDIPKPAILRPQNLWTGKQLFSLLVKPNNDDLTIDYDQSLNSAIFQGDRLGHLKIKKPKKWPDISFQLAERNYSGSFELCPNDGYVHMRRSMLISGNVAKNTIGQGSKNGLVYTLYKDHGATAAATCMNRIAKLAARYLGYHCGFSIGIGDVTPSNELNQLKQREIFQGNADAAEQIKLFKNGQLPLKPGCDAGQSLEVELSGLLGKVREKCGKLAMKTLPRANAPRLMAESGAKGSALNVSQMTACLGQQAVDGKRVADGFYRRTLPHFPFDALEPAAKGFVQNSFFSGLSATEFFFHTMGGREGLVDTAVKSISWDTRIIVVDQGVCKHIEIGRWIDQRLASHKTKVKFYPNDHNLEVLNVSNVWISTTDMEGNISWGSVTALTRHDPGDVLYKIKTQSGREVTVTASKSLLVWDPKRRCLQEKEPAHVNTGDFVPVTEFLPTPRNYTTTIDLDSIFSKTEYIHGTQFHIALSLMKSAKHSHEKNARGWWKSNLGTKFSLPFSTMAQLQQFINKSECIKSGYIYQCATYGIDACIADKFELSYENGQFIGLFLAQGYAKETNVKITTIEDSVITFLRSWFTRWNINFVQEVSGSTILGYSTLLARLLHQFCGGASKNKFVPKEAFLASKEFVCGILSGFISGSGSIDEGGISASSASEILIEGISSLCTRLSIFCQTFVDSNDNYCITINTLWIDRFRQMVKLVHVPKQQKLMKLSTLTKIHMTKINDIVLDTIVSIDQVSPTLYPKMYDLTVPSTLNFGLANGLQVRDTAQTGYMARRLMKALEDLSVQYDGTVRNSESNIVQLVFGDDGLDPGKMEANDGPVDFDRLLFRLLSGDASPTEEDTNELTIDGFLPPQNTLAIKNSYDLDDTPAVRFQQEVKHFFEKKNIDPQTAATFKKLASWKYMRTLVEAGEAVGAVGAQCISEPGTQMTLKTFHFAGVASMNVTLGVPRLTEIINASKSISTPIITAALDNAYDAGVARVVKARLEKTTLGEVCKEMKQVFDLKNGACLEVVLDLHLINDLDLNVNLASARSAVINAKTQAKCPPILRVLNAEHLQIRGGAGNLDTFRVMLPSCDSIKSTTTNAWKPGNYYSTAHSSKIKLDHGDDPTIFALHALKQALPNVVVTGIPSVNRVVINSDEKETNKYHLLVEGYGLEQVMGTEGVDGRNTTTNHVNELESVLGIEAARATISSEISYIMRAYGISIDRRHLALLSDVMTFKGLVLGITRFGVSKMRESVLMLASFERTTDHLFDAAVHGRNDKIVGVSECIIMGIPIPLGTGSFKLLQDNHASGTAPLPPESINKKKILSPFHKKRSLIMNHYR